MNRIETATLLAVLRTVWTDIVITEDTVTGWHWALEDTPYPLVEAAAKRYIRTGKFAPKPAELLELVGTDRVAPGLVPEAAWTEVLAEVRRVGFNRPPVFSGGKFWPPEVRAFSNPLIGQAVDAIGWETICTSDKPEIVRAQFVKALDAITRRAVRNVQTGETPAAGELTDATEPVPALGNGRRP